MFRASKLWSLQLFSGTGKSRIAEAVSNEIESTFYSVSSADLLSSWFGESEKLIKELFQHARRKTGRAIIFIDEIDSLCRKRDSKEAETTRRVKTELLKQMEGANKRSAEEADVFFLGATNCPWELDSAFLRRFEKRVYIPLPDREARRDLLSIHLGDVKVSLSDAEWNRILDRTEGFSESDLATCISDALLEPIREMSENIIWKWSEDKKWLAPCEDGVPGAIRLRLQSIPRDKVQPRPLLFKDLMRSLDANHSTVSIDDLQKYAQFTTSFGQIG